MAKRRHKNILYPPVVIAHISRDLSDLVIPYINDKSYIEVYLSSQPNSNPHLGTLTTFASAFALAYNLRARFGLDSKVTLEALDNAPTSKRKVNGFTYFKPMCFVRNKEGLLSEKNLELFEHFMDGMEKRSSIPYSIKRYSIVQGHPEYRENLRNILCNEEGLAKFLNPLEEKIKLRSVCPSCLYGEKSGRLTRKTLEDDGVKLVGHCFTHGEYKQFISFAGGGFIDLNTPVRSLIRKTLLMDESKKDNSLKIMVDGADWISMSQQFLPCFGVLGYSISDLPIRFFAPLIEDWAGSKFSKSAYVKRGIYKDIHPSLCDYEAFKNSLGENGLDLIWGETLGWISDSKKFFRNYTIDYFIQKWNLDLR